MSATASGRASTSTCRCSSPASRWPCGRRAGTSPPARSGAARLGAPEPGALPGRAHRRRLGDARRDHAPDLGRRCARRSALEDLRDDERFRDSSARHARRDELDPRDRGAHVALATAEVVRRWRRSGCRARRSPTTARSSPTSTSTARGLLLGRRPPRRRARAAGRLADALLRAPPRSATVPGPVLGADTRAVAAGGRVHRRRGRRDGASGRPGGPMTEDLADAREGGVLTVTFDRPRQHNAMTFEMYDALHDACEGGRRRRRRPGAGAAWRRRQGLRLGHRHRAVPRLHRRLRRHRLRGADHPGGQPARGGRRAHGRGGAGLLPRGRPGAGGGLRPAGRDPRLPVRCPDRADARQLPVDQLRLDAGGAPGPARTLDLLLRARLLDADEAHAAGFVAEVSDDERSTRRRRRRRDARLTRR